MSNEKTPDSQEGRHEFDVTLPADRTKSGEEETVRIGFRWKVSATRPPTARERPGLAADEARRKLAILADTPTNENGIYVEWIEQVDQLESALALAIESWCRSQLRDADSCLGSTSTFLQAFGEKAPDDLRVTASSARTAIREYVTHRIPMQESLAAVQAAVDVLLAAAARRPRSRRRFPAHLRSRRSPRKLRVRPGSWIDTGRYRPAVILEMMPDPPNIMKLSYGDEIDEEFRPHIWPWRSVRKRRRVPSLKDVFSPGDWIRNPRKGYGRVLAVRNSSMRVDFRGREATCIPDAILSRHEKIDEPAPEELLPADGRFPPGTWIEYDTRDEGVVLAVEGDLLKVLLRYGGSVRDFFASGPGVDGPVRKMDIPALDLKSSFGRRWSWWWLHEDIFREPVCACCGYPNFGQDDPEVPGYRDCLICGHLNFDSGLEDDDVPVGLRGDDCQQHRNAWDYTDTDESDARPGDAVTDLRRSLVRLLEKRRVEPSSWCEEEAKAVEGIRREILARLG